MDWKTQMGFMRQNQQNGLGPFDEKMLDRINALHSYCQVAGDYAIAALESARVMPTVQEGALSCFDNLIEQAQAMRTIIAAVPVRDVTPATLVADTTLTIAPELAASLVELAAALDKMAKAMGGK